MDSYNGLILLAIVFLLTLLYLRTYFLTSSRVKELVDKFPGPKPLPFFGNSLTFAASHTQYFKILSEFARKWPRKCRVWMFGHPFVLVYHPETAAPMFSSNVNIDKPDDYNIVAEGFGRGLITKNGEKWKTSRKMIGPTFHFRKLEGYISVFNKHAAGLAAILYDVVDTTISVEKYCQKTTLGILCEAAMGYHLNTKNKRDLEFASATQRTNELVTSRLVTPWLWPDFIFYRSPTGREFTQCTKIIRNLSAEIIDKKKKEWKPRRRQEKEGEQLNDTKEREAFLDMLLDLTDGGNDVSSTELLEEVITFMTAGHETTAATFAYVLLTVGNHPEVQKKVHAEMDSIFGNNYKRPVTTDDVGNMKYLDCVIKEQMRLWSTVPFISRQVKEDVIVDGEIIPAGAKIGCLLWLLHRNPDAFPNPLVFDPDRFLPENTRDRNPYAFAPFSSGQRNCLGQKFATMELKILLSWVFRLYIVKSEKTMDEIEPGLNITIIAGLGVPIRLSLRKGIDVSINDLQNISM